MNNDPWDWRKPSESPAEALGTGLLMLALICISIVCLALISP